MSRQLTVPLRPCLAVAAVAALSLAMFPARPDGLVGMYTSVTISAALAAGLLTLAACLLPAWTINPPASLGSWIVAIVALLLAGQAALFTVRPPPETVPWMSSVVSHTAVVVAAVAVLRRSAGSLPNDLVSALAIALSAEGVFCSVLNPPQDATAQDLVRFAEAASIVHLAALAGFLVTASLFLFRPAFAGRKRWVLGTQVLLVFAAGAVLRLTAAVAARDPGMDLFYALQDGPTYLLEGQNPYTAHYDWPGSPFYPPLPLLLCLPVRAVGLDARLVNAVCDLIAAGALLAAAWSRSRYLLGALLASAYLHFPRVPLMMELAWYEPMLAALLGVGLLVSRRGFRAGYVLLALAVTGKQYGLALLPSLLKGLPRRFTLLLAVLATAVAIVMPFFLWNHEAFLETVVFWHLRQEVRNDGVTLQALAKNVFDVTLPRSLMRLGTVLLIGCLAWRTPARGSSPAPWLAAALLVFFLFHNQAFINYFYLCEYLFLLGLTDWFDGDSSCQSDKVARSFSTTFSETASP